MRSFVRKHQALSFIVPAFGWAGLVAALGPFGRRPEARAA